MGNVCAAPNKNKDSKDGMSPELTGPKLKFEYFELHGRGL